MILDDDNFETTVHGGLKQLTFVKFLAPWWGHCKRMKPDWDRLGDYFNRPEMTAQVADVDCTNRKNDELCQKYGVSGYPTLKYFSKDTPDTGEKYEGPRTYMKMKRFVKAES